MNKKGQDMTPIWSPTMIMLLALAALIVIIVGMISLSGGWGDLVGKIFG